MAYAEDVRVVGSLGQLNDAVQVNYPTMATVTFQLVGSPSMTVTFECNDDEGASPSWRAISATNVTTGVAATTATAAGIYRIDASGLRLVRARCSNYVSGSFVTTCNASVATGQSAGGGGGGGGASTIADGADVAEGATTDVKVTGDNAGTVSAKLRGLNYEFGDQADAAATTDTGTFSFLAFFKRLLSRITTLWPQVTVATTFTAPATAPGVIAMPFVFNGAGANWGVPQSANNLVTGAAGGATPTAAVMVYDPGTLKFWPLEGTQAGGAFAQGPGAAGAALVGNPVQVGGSDGTNTRALSTDATGRVQIAAINGALPAGTNALGTVTANQGTANTAANAWPAKLTDGTNTAAVKAASTAAVATDPAAVVTLSPNTALPAGANALGSVTVTGTPAISGTVTANQGTQNGAGTASWNVQGAAAVGATTAGNPVPTGLTDASGNAQYWRQANASGVSFASPYVGVGAVMSYLNDAANVAQVCNTARQNTDNTPGANMPGVALMMANAATSPNFDKVRNNVDVTLLASAARTTTQTSADIVTYNAHSIIVTLDMTVVGTGSVTLSINYKDPASGKYIALLTGAAVSGNSTNMYTINPNIPAVANVSAQKDLGRIIQIVVTANNSNTATYSVGYTLVN